MAGVIDATAAAFQQVLVSRRWMGLIWGSSPRVQCPAEDPRGSDIAQKAACTGRARSFEMEGEKASSRHSLRAFATPGSQLPSPNPSQDKVCGVHSLQQWPFRSSLGHTKTPLFIDTITIGVVGYLDYPSSEQERAVCIPCN